MDLIRRSLDILLENQAETGAFVACPNYGPYQYCWFRDGSFTAYALDQWGERQAAEDFFHWSSKVILDRTDHIEKAIERARQGLALQDDAVLHARYTLDGREVTDMPWANFQLDGLGTWLWALVEHLQGQDDQDVDERLSRAADLVSDYLLALWNVPCFDIWEENNKSLHVYTLASIWSGLKRWGDCSGRGKSDAFDQIRQFLLHNGVVDGVFVRSLNNPVIDASLLGLAVPTEAVDLDDERMARTVERIEDHLRRDNGVHRNMDDSYYGGGAWLLLSDWLAWYYLELEQYDKVTPLIEWVESQADQQGWMPEQVAQNLNVPSALEKWRSNWGDSARPLLWSHSKYLIVSAKAGREHEK